MSVEPHIAIEIDNPLLNAARIEMIERHRQVFFRASARQATQHEGSNWIRLPQQEKLRRIEAETAVGDAMGVPMIPVYCQTIEAFQKWLSNKNSAKYLMPRHT